MQQVVTMVEDIHRRYLRQLQRDNNGEDILCILEKYMRSLRKVGMQVATMYETTESLCIKCRLHDVDITVADGAIFLRFGALLPKKVKMQCDLIHNHLKRAINSFISQTDADIPLFQKAVVILRHHYANVDTKRKLTDYDNLERKGAIDSLVPLFLSDDNPRRMRIMEMMIPDAEDFTEMILMEWGVFLEFIHAPENRF